MFLNTTTAGETSRALTRWPHHHKKSGCSMFIQEAAKHLPGKCRHVLLQQRECSAIPWPHCTGNSHNLRPKVYRRSPWERLGWSKCTTGTFGAPNPSHQDKHSHLYSSTGYDPMSRQSGKIMYDHIISYHKTTYDPMIFD